MLYLTALGFAAPSIFSETRLRAAEWLVDVNLVGAWGDADTDQIEKILEWITEIATEPLTQAEITGLPSEITVEYASNGPYAAFGDPFDNTVTVRLSSYDNRWSWFSAQFGHELGHVLCNYRHSDYQLNSFQWIDEACCGALMIYCLENLSQMAVASEHTRFRRFGANLVDYVSTERARYASSASASDWATWYHSNSEALAELRELNSLNMPLAAALSTTFQNDPAYISGLRYLHTWFPHSDGPLSDFISEWENACPTGRDGLPRALRRAFQI